MSFKSCSVNRSVICGVSSVFFLVMILGNVVFELFIGFCLGIMFYFYEVEVGVFGDFLS